MSPDEEAKRLWMRAAISVAVGTLLCAALAVWLIVSDGVTPGLALAFLFVNTAAYALSLILNRGNLFESGCAGCLVLVLSLIVTFGIAGLR